MSVCDQRAYEAAFPELSDDDLLETIETEITLDELCQALAAQPCSFGPLALGAGRCGSYHKQLIGAAVLRVRRDLAERRLALVRDNERRSRARAQAVRQETVRA